MQDSLRYEDLGADTPEPTAAYIQRLCDKTLDAVILRGAMPTATLEPVAAAIAGESGTAGWNRPNRPVPGIDLRLLGMGAAPCATMPGGPTEAEYLATAVQTSGAIRELFGPGCDPINSIEAHLGQLSGLPVAVPRTPDGSHFSPCTLRALPEGTGLMVHHDNHYTLQVYDGIRAQIDTDALLSFFVLVGEPVAGGRLCVFDRGPDDDAELPFLDSGLPDPEAFVQQVPHAYFDLRAGDLIVFASSRLYHTVEPVSGPKPRITLGGFAGLNRGHDQVLYWS